MGPALTMVRAKRREPAPSGVLSGTSRVLRAALSVARPLVLVLTLGTVAGSAAAADPAPGTYIAEGGSGSLKITRRGQALNFAIDTVGANGHLCGLDGRIANARAVLPTMMPGKTCTVTFTPSPGAVEVGVLDNEPCRDFCGMRAWFPGTYLLPPAECQAAAYTAARRRFNTLYRAKAYAQAEAALSPLLAQCAKTTDWFEEGRVRNDLAITLYHLGQREKCAALLKPVLERGANEDQLRENLPPSDFDSYLPIARAAWHNARLCAG